MKRSELILYWFITLWLALGMVSTGIVQLIQLPEEVQKFSALGYPAYLMTILAVWKLLGTVAILIPGRPMLKEWAYAGFFFAMSGAAISHLCTGHPMKELFPSLLLLTLTFVSWHMRPASRKVLITTTNKNS